MREEEMHGSYEAQEAAFERVQHRRRTVIRVKEGRERPSDVLVKNLMLVEAGRQRCSALPAAHRSESAALVADPAVDFEVAEPYAVVSALPAVELRALLRDIATLAGMGAEADGTSADELRRQAAEEAALLAEQRGAGPGEAAEAVRQARVRAEAELEAKRARYARYWACLAVLAEDSLQQAEAEEAGEETGIGGLPTSVERDVIQTMALKDAQGLAELERDVIRRAEEAAAADAALGSTRGGGGGGGGAAPATGGLSVAAYWQAVLRAVAVLRARQELRSIHRELLRQRQKHLARVLKDTMRDAGVAQALWDQADEVDETAAGTAEQTLPPVTPGQEHPGMAPAAAPAAAAAAAAAAASSPAAAAGSGAASSRPAAGRAVSPTPLRGASATEAAAEAATSEVEVVSPGDLQRLVELERSRAAARLRGRADGSGGAAAAAAVAAADAATTSSSSSSADRAPTAQMTVQEAIERGLLRSNEFSQEAAETFVGPADGAVAGAVDRSMLTPEEQAAFADRFRPRRPRYITRVRSGYHWNSHNKAYYDRDNPPPKMVQGYKFDVFYPDLLDPSKPPTFSLEPADSPAFCMLRIHGGPPYEDVAFKIVNREWLTGKRSGYVCAFDRGVYKLFFNLKTHFYRR
ncbi:hypothetical protein FNF27_02185 [Cafeteria roenbergensis]|uniref:Splicing factor Cactin n=2 Tax=Cafeteria roenbergensis TaxID=33653 RepID=A0A5A8EG16_CAFRO|nr:hypothetical protein FNF27_02185 [Cafeteria roenbergensis]